MKRVLFIASSPSLDTSEFTNIWAACPERRWLSASKIMLNGDGWSIVVFDGTSSDYCSVKWRYSVLSSEIQEFVNQESSRGLQFGVLVHGSKDELNRLCRTLNWAEIQAVAGKSYSSHRGSFYTRYIVPFAYGANDEAFDALWAKIWVSKGLSEDLSLQEEIKLIRHRCKTWQSFMSQKVLSLKETRDSSIFTEFKDFRPCIAKAKVCFQTPAPQTGEFEKDIAQMFNARVDELLEEIECVCHQTQSFEERLQRAVNCHQRMADIIQLLEKV